MINLSILMGEEKMLQSEYIFSFKGRFYWYDLGIRLLCKFGNKILLHTRDAPTLLNSMTFIN
jgi:hypothetical protein